MKTQAELIRELAQIQHEAESVTRLMHDLADHLARTLDAKSLVRKELDSSYEQTEKD
jgi:hypothetical protein